MKKFTIIIASLFYSLSNIVYAQTPKEFIMGKLKFEAANHSSSGLYATHTDKSATFNLLLSSSVVNFNENSYTEIGSDVIEGGILALSNGIDNLPPLITSRVKSYEESNVGTPNEGNR